MSESVHLLLSGPSDADVQLAMTMREHSDELVRRLAKSVIDVSQEIEVFFQNWNQVQQKLDPHSTGQVRIARSK